MADKVVTLGIFSSRSSFNLDDSAGGEGVQKSYWFVQELEDGSMEVQALNSNNLPSGPKLTIEKERFLSNYHPEPEFYNNEVLPGLREQEERIVRGEGHRHKDEVYSAEYEFKAAIKVDEDNVRANFGLGLTYLDRGELDRAEDVFKRLLGLKATYEPRHKHLFNEFGINLRKSGMFKQALEYYRRAEDLCRNDENLFLNIARAYYEDGNLEKCIDYLNKSFELKPDFEEARLFRDFLKINGFMTDKGEAAMELDEMEKFKKKKVPMDDLILDY